MIALPEVLSPCRDNVGNRFEFTSESWSDGEKVERSYVVLAAPEHHGYQTPGGGWALNPQVGDVRSWRVLGRRAGRGRYRNVWVPLDCVVSARVVK